ncbi:beta-ketodecanoyl-[acyl-carrier-protein] synthase [Hasllibacter halocynthiae]|uniref:Beta-ketodecanoyl-[acyl-carrier-protein] synthase n=1 Tax=Hasllibacter halocynthiae TaxID=595589 RepID=A0A2T0X143_9RHOB|nr:beta-ketoacyl-ACP synthase III [Hasllibacter halocynthiae]PRY92574.1 beta-ketodecanoyl-[acyl-carrier-protein] synthase [Hasllibacter halocynthiae]
MPDVFITGAGLWTPPERITNDELVASFNAYVDRFNAGNAAAIEAGTVDALAPSSADFIAQASGIEARHVIDKEGVLDPARMVPKIPPRPDDAPSLMAEMAVSAAESALAEAGIEAGEIDATLCAASNHERAYPAIAVEIQDLIGAGGFAYDLNVACSSATFAIQSAADMIRAGSIHKALIVNPEICSAHLEWRDRDCHFIFGDVATALVLEAEEKPGTFKVLGTKLATRFSNNIRNNDGFLRRTHDQMEDRRDMQFMQEGRKVFKEVVPMVSAHILEHLQAVGVAPDELRRLWLHQANKAMNDYVGRKVLGRTPEPGEQPNVLQDYANTSSAGSIIAFSKHRDDIAPGEKGVICSFGAGYSVGSVVVERV